MKLYHIYSHDGTSFTGVSERIPYLFASEELAKEYSDRIFSGGSWNSGSIRPAGDVIEEFDEELAEQLWRKYG